MSTLWIVHRDPRQRTALARLAAASDSDPRGGPGDPLFDAAPSADVVILGLGGDLEAELQFAHRTATRLPAARWVLVAERGDAPRVKELFDTLDAALLTYPPGARALRAHIRTPRPAYPGAGARLPLSRRPGHDRLAERFGRWFADVELPEVLRALDPKLATVAVLIRGESGTGRGLVARYLHGYGVNADGSFDHAVCEPSMSPAQLAVAVTHAAGAPGNPHTIWLDGPDSLPRSTQRQLARWIELGATSELAHLRVARWIATCDDEPPADPSLRLDDTLRDALGGIALRLPTVRERSHFVAAFSNATVQAWFSTRHTPMRRFGEDAIAVLEEYPWPGNTRELETVVVQTLASGSSDPIRADDLQYDGTAFAPLDAGEFGQLLADTEREPPPAGPREQAPSAAPEPEPVPERDDGNSEPEGESGTGAESAAREGGETRRASPRIQPLLGAIAHEMRNPLSTIRTFAELLPDRYDDAEFRTRFSELVTHDTRRLESVLQRLSELATLARPNPTLVDVATMVSELLVEQRARLRERKLVVLQQLEPGGVSARADVAQLRGALDALLGKTMQLAPEGGDVTVAVRHGERDGAPAPGAQIELCFGGEPGGRPGFAGVSAAENSLEFVVAEAIVRLQGGTFRLESGKAGETVVIVDLPG